MVTDTGNRRKGWLKRILGILVILLLAGLTFYIVAYYGQLPKARESSAQEELENKYREEREMMVEYQLKGRDITDPKVLEVMSQIPRHQFVPEEYKDQAYEDHPLPIGEGQTISQPYIVALMTQNLELQGDEKVLEIGTGSGYQAAILSKLVQEVYTVEIIKSLGLTAKEQLKRLGYDNVVVQVADGYYGWPEHAPFDAIIVTAAPDHVPPPLLDQLKDGGIMVIPVGPPGSYQTLWKLTKKGDQIISKNLGGVIFVPLTGGAREKQEQPQSLQ